MSRKEEFIQHAVEKIMASRIQDLEHMQNSVPKLPPGALVLVHQTRRDMEFSKKVGSRWAGPYVVVRRFESGSYQIRELDGAVIKEAVAANRIKLFYYRESQQEILGVPRERQLLFGFWGQILQSTWGEVIANEQKMDIWTSKFRGREEMTNIQEVLEWSKEFQLLW